MRNDDANCYGSVVPFKMTDIGEGIKEVELLQWFVRPGDTVAQFDRVCEVQSDKATVEITSRYDGTVVALHHAVGAMVPTGATLMEIAAPASAAAAAAVAPPPPPSPSLSTADTAPAPPPVLTSASPTSGAAPAAAEFELAAAAAAAADVRAAEGGGGGAAVLTTPAVRRAAREYGVDLQRLRASGPRGRVLKGDVEAYARAHRLERGAAAEREPPAAAAAAAAAPSVMLNIAPAVTVRWGRLERPPLNGGGSAAAHINGSAHMRLNGSASTPVPATLPSPPPPPPPAVQAAARPRAAEAQAQLPPPSPAVFVAPPPHQQLQPQAPAPQQQDWQQQQQRQQQQQQRPLSDFPAHEPAPAPAEALIPLRGMQRAMAEHMKRALQVPHMGYCDEVLMDRMAALRADIRAARGAADPAAARLSFLPIIIKATSLALARHPILNSSMAPCGTALQPHADQNIGVAMDTPRGLVVPNIKRVQTLSILEIAAELQRLQAEGAAGRLTERDLSGGTFTLSNIGTIGGTYASPVLLVPQVGIGALGRVRTLPRYDAGGALVPAPLMTVSWAADHRVVDGATLARFSNAWKGFLENPALMLAESR